MLYINVQTKLQVGWNYIKKFDLLYYFLLFFLAFIPRLWDLGSGLTIDEELWLVRAPNFFNAIMSLDFSSTFQAIHPGVITMWISGFAIYFFTHNNTSIPELLTIARFPIALVTTLGILCIYFLVKKIFNQEIGFIAGVFIALDPFFLAHSRVIHLDALLTTFMVLSLLYILYFLKGSQIKYLFLSGFFSALAILTKIPALFLCFFLPFIMIIYNKKSLLNTKCFIKNKAFHILLLLSTIIVVIFILWPVLWIEPVDTIIRISGVNSPNTLGLINVIEKTHGGGFFLGSATQGDRGPLFYLILSLMMMTPINMVFFVIFLVFFIRKIYLKTLSNNDEYIIFLILFIILYGSQMSLAAKTFGRYILPIFPVIDILAAIGLYYVISSIRILLPHIKDKIFPFTVIIIIICNIMILAPITPYYLSYYNPWILGGPKNAPNITNVGWGEGNDLAASYLNEKPNSSKLIVAYQFQGFDKYFNGTSKYLHDIKDIKNASLDYIVFYINTLQIGFEKELWEQYNQKKPDKVIQINNIEYCYIYRVDMNITNS